MNDEELDIFFATPPCQGMSKNGRGKLLQGVRAGRKPSLDARNRLIIPTLEIARALKPRLVVFENVPEMAIYGFRILGVEAENLTTRKGSQSRKRLFFLRPTKAKLGMDTWTR